MANTVGKISGQMLESNLLRKEMQTGDENLAFETDLIYLDVFNNRVGINTDTPFRTLLVNSDIKSTNFIVDTQATIDDLVFTTNVITNNSGNINLSSPLGEIQASKFVVGNFELDNSAITNLVLNQDININPTGTGKLNFINNVRIDGNLHATGNITADGNLVFGDNDTDNIIFNAQIGSDIIPDLNNNYSIGSNTKNFKDLYTYLINGASLTTGGAVVGGIDLSIRPGNTWYVSTNGSNSNVGDHPNGPFATVEYALSQSISGDTVYIYAGSYLENFPLTVPVGVTVKGEGPRSVTIQPAVDSETDDVFKLNGETTVTDLTIKNFGGFGFSFDNNFTVTSRSPYIQNVSLITNTTLYPKITLNDPNPDANSQSDNFGSSIKASASYVIVGAPGENGSSGAAYIYSINGTLLHTLTNPNAFGTTVSDEFGYSVGISESYAIVGARQEDTTLYTSAGKAYIFSTTTGALLFTLDNPAIGTNLQFGCSVAISESYAIVATRFRAYIFSTSTGALLQTIIPPSGAGSAPGGRVGCQVDITETHAIIGAATAFTSSGRAYIYNPATGALLFTLVNPNATGATVADHFGSIVALSTSYAVVTAPFEDVGGSVSGTAYVYQLSTGTLLYTLNDPNAYGTPTNDLFGWLGAAISDSYIVVGADSEDDDSGTSSGKVYIFSTDTGELLYTLDNPRVFGTTSVDRFGYAVAVTGLKVIVGSPFEDDSTYTEAGKTFVYDLYKGGALIDGSKATVSSKEASMLFHSVTMIIPNSYGLVMSNGVRVEWLNSFIYYAYKGLYGINGSSGFASLGTRFGAEIRSIGSANVYGNYGAWADGDEVLMYLINHNFGYIGSGLDNNNDPTDVIQANEVVRLNDGKIYYQSMDHTGDFRVGDIFKVESSTGAIEFQTSVVSNTSLTLNDGVNVTIIDADEVTTGNIKISGNTIQSIIGPLNFNSNNNTINVVTDLNVQAALTVNSILNQTGNASLGDVFDTIEFLSSISSNILPNTNNLDLGSQLYFYNNLYASQLIFDNFLIQGNLIETIDSNSDIELRSNGTGNVLFDSNTVVGQNLILQGTFNGPALTVNNLTANNLVIENLTTISTVTSFDDLDFIGNQITTTLSNADLELSSNGTGSISLPSNNLNVYQNLNVIGTSSLYNVTVSDSANVLGSMFIDYHAIDEYNNGDILIRDNFITTTLSNSPLELKGNSLGGVVFDNTIKITNSSINNEVLVGSEFVKSINFIPFVNYIVDINTTTSLKLPVGNNTNRILTNSGEMRFNNINLSFEGKNLQGTKNLIGVNDLDNNTYILPELTPGANQNTLYFYTNNSLSATIDSNKVQLSKLIVDEIEINNNRIRTFNTNAEIQLETSGTGILNLQNNFTAAPSIITNITNNAITEIKSTGTGYVKFTDSKGLRIPTGTDAQRPVSVPIGSTRYSTDQGYLEVWDGTTWSSASGGGPTVSSLVMEDLSDTYALIFG